MSTHRLTRTAVLAAAPAAVLMLPQAATAQTLEHTDPAGDVYSLDMRTGETFDTPAPDRAEGDVTSARFNHRGTTVTARMSFRELSKTTEETIHIVRIRTNEGVKRDVMVFAGPGGWGGQVMVARPNGSGVRCAGVQRTIDYTANTFTLSVPRRCLSAPRWVRVAAATVTMDRTKAYADDAQSDTIADSGPVLGPRLRRG